MYLQKYSCPMGQLLLAADDSALVQLSFDAEKQLDFLPKDIAFVETPVLQATKRWLNIYFSGQEPDFMPPLRPTGTDFQQKVWQLLRQIPYGETTTYGEIARALATDPKLLLLDEPAAGMNPQETQELAEYIKEIRDSHHLTVFLIEHHMDLVMKISDYIYVIDFGSEIARGVPKEVQQNKRVIEAYLGVTEDA